MLASAIPPKPSSRISECSIASLAFESNRSSREVFPTRPTPERECFSEPMKPKFRPRPAVVDTYELSPMQAWVPLHGLSGGDAGAYIEAAASARHTPRH